MAYTQPPARSSANPVASADWNTYVKDNFIEVEARKETDYVEVTSSVTISATSAATANTIITGTAFTPSGSDKYRFEFGIEEVALTVVSSVIFHLYEGATNLGRLAVVTNPAAAAMSVPVYGAREFTPTNVSHTYSIRAHRVTANATATAGAGGADVAFPIWFRTTRLP